MPILISDLASRIKSKAKQLGFDEARLTSAHLPPSVGHDLAAYVAAGHHGSMAWMAETQIRRATPDAMWVEAKSAVVLAMNYHQGLDAFARLKQKSFGVISSYALNRDYHDLIKGKLKTLAGWLAQETGEDVKVFVDTAPMMEKPLAQQAGLGWQGKHTNLLSRDWGNWFFIGTILTTAELPGDEPEQVHCGSCRACLDICPTQAFTAAHRIDARRCISYLTIEHPGTIAMEFRKAMGNRIYGCDDCLAICPWNKYAQVSREAKLLARADLLAPALSELLKLDDASFRKLFSGSPIKRIGVTRFLRNVLIAAGNSQDPSLKMHVRPYLQHEDAVLRAMAVWALRQLLNATEFAELKREHTSLEQDAAVVAEWQGA